MSLKKKLSYFVMNNDKPRNEVFDTTQSAHSSQEFNIVNDCITSRYFSQSIAEQFINIELEFNNELKLLIYDKPIEVIYNPIEYAFEVHKIFIHRFLNSQKKVLFLGMNPGPFGMCQTGIPFGSVPEVRDWMHITGEVKKPANEIPVRPILGFNCKRNEISGKRFWGVFKELCINPENFFTHCFVHNLCPLLFLNSTGKNITPSELKGHIKYNLMQICERWLLRVIQCLNVKIIVGIGRFAQERALRAVKSSPVDSNCIVEFLPHPSPRSVGNTNWNPVAIEYLTKLNLIDLLMPAAC